MDWETLSQSQDTGCIGYATVADRLTCHDKKKDCMFYLMYENHQPLKVSIQVIQAELYGGRSGLFREAEYRF